MVRDSSRRERLLEIVRLNGFASLPNLVNELEVSGSTIRRDLDFLENTGVVRRTHGGVFYTGPTPKVTHFEHRQGQSWSEKKAIARAAAASIKDGETILLDGGSTTYELAQCLIGRPIQVVTNSLPVATLFTSGDSADVVLIGGYVHGRTGVCTGPYANSMLRELNVQTAIISVAGANEGGFYNSNLLLVETEREMMRSADKVTVVADSTKFGHTSLARLCELKEISTLVADNGLSEHWREQLEMAGVDVIIAEYEAMEKETVA